MPPKKPLHPYRTLCDVVLLSDITIDTTGVYIAGYAYDTGPRLWAVGPDPVSQGDPPAPRALIPQDGPPISLVRADESGVYAVTSGEILEVDRSSGALTLVARTPPAMTLALALDGEWLYGTTVGEAGGVFRAPKAGGSLEWLFRGRANTVAASEGRVAYAAAGKLVVHLPGGEPTPVPDVVNPRTLHFFGNELIWTEFDAAGGIVALDLATGTRRPLTAAVHPCRLTSAGRHLYWTVALTKPNQPWIWRMDPQDPASVEPLVKGRSKGGHLAAGAGALVWIDDCGGGAHRMELATI